MVFRLSLILLFLANAISYGSSLRKVDGDYVRSSSGAILWMPLVSPTINRACYFDEASGGLKSSLVTGTELGYLSGVSQAIQTQIDSKQAFITPGTASQYWRGDKTFQNLTTSAVTEGSNLYYLDSRVASYASSATSSRVLYVSKEKGSDSTGDGSIFKPYATIQKGVNMAALVPSTFNTPVVVKIFPHNTSTGYAEDITLSQQGTSLDCISEQYRSDTCLVKGTVTVNLTGTAGGANFSASNNHVYIKGLYISKTAGTALVFSGSVFQRLFITGSFVESTSTASGAIITNTGISGSIKSTITSRGTDWQSSNATTPVIDIQAGRLFIAGDNPAVSNGNASGPSIVAASGAVSLTCNGCAIDGQVKVTSNTANVTITNSAITAGTNSCIASPASPSTGVITYGASSCSSSNTNSVTGSGVLVIDNVARTSSSGDIVSTVTQAVLPNLPKGEVIIGAGAVTGTNVLLSIKGGHIKVAQTTAPTATVNANAGTGATCTLSNATDVAGAINITTGTLGVGTGEYCKVTFNKAYGVAPICLLSSANANLATTNSYVTTNTASMAVNFATAGGISTSYVTNYHCLETQ